MSATLRGCAELAWQSWRTDRTRLTAGLVLMTGQAAAMPLTAFALAALTDAVLAKDLAGATVAGGAVGVLVIAALTLGHFAHLAYFELGELNLLTFDRWLIDLAHGTPGLEHHERPEYADKFHVLRQELQRVGWRGMQALLPAAGLVVAIGITGVLLARLDPMLLLLPLAAVPPLLAGRRAEALLDRARDRAAEPKRRAWHLFELATVARSAQELLVCGLRDELRTRHAALWAAATRTLWRAELAASGLRVAGQLTFAVAYVAATLLVVRDAVAGRHGAGDVVLVVMLAAQINHQMTAGLALLQELQRAARALTTLRWARTWVRTSVSGPSDTMPPERIRDGIRLRGVTFRYPGTDRVVLDDVDLYLPAGSTVALVGENGTGKTTLVKLLCRFYELDHGAIDVDGIDLRRFPVHAWRQRIAAGFQDFVRFELLARHTVGIGDLDLMDSTEAVVSALERARATDVVNHLAQGLDTHLGKSHQDGAELSGGQWQKLALARAMMRQTPLLVILDEPTSALDAEAEHRLFERYATAARRVGRQTGGVTLLVSHRFSTVRAADLILVVSRGRIIESGDHDRLMAAGGAYAELYRLQATAYQ